MNPRFKQINKLLAEHSIDALLISSIANIIYLTGYSNFSRDEREAFLLITSNGQFIFTDGRYTTAIKKQVKKFTLVEISSKHKFSDALKDILKKKKINVLGIEESDVKISEYKMIKQAAAKVKPLNIQNLRIRKSSEEIKLIKKTCTLSDNALAYILEQIKPGLTEKQIAFKLEFFIKENGGDLSFNPIIAFGANAAIPHHQTGNQKLKTKDLILLDFGVRFKNYCSDMTRTVFLGKATSEQKKVYQTVLSGQQKAIEYIQSFYSSSEVERSETKSRSNSSRLANARSNNKYLLASGVDKASRDFIISQGYPSIPHSLGHGIGIEVHELPTLSPVSKQTLTEGMVFSIEPGIYLPGKFGIRIEDLFVIENQRLRQLTRSPNNLIEL